MLHTQNVTYRLIWLAEVEPMIVARPDLASVLRPAFERGYKLGRTAIKVPESEPVRRALATVRG